MPDQAGQETARIVLALDTAITAFRQGSVRLTPRVAMGDDLADDAIARANGRRRVPNRPDRVELAVLTALAETYCAELLTNASLGSALRLVARHGGVGFVQRVLRGETASDAQLAAMLTAAVPRSLRSRQTLSRRFSLKPTR
jgi:hypothetical protein